MKNKLKTCSNQIAEVKKAKILVEAYSTVQPKFTKANWSGGEGDDNA
ncbi:hypothetical protein [Nostoc sp. C057]|jgi:hypothetical protein|nr:hypothetical protein [Nostoc sp. C057]